MSQPERTRTTVRIAGRDYVMSGVDSEDHIRRVAAYVDRKMEELRLTARHQPQMIPVLVAMNIADELLKAEDENTRLRQEMDAMKARASKRAAKKVAEEQ